ncbi:MAG TPA: GNAT family N-acetyltransferase [Thermomicrobiales bacterium]|mgnify:CR=1 FL=1
MTAMTQSEAGELTLLDGTVVHYRAIRPEDAPALQRFHSRLSERSIYQRFFGVMPVLSDQLAHRFTHVDGYDRFALVALDPTDPNELIGVARFDREPGTDRAEYAAIVVDQWQGRGLGLALTRRLVDAARRRNVRHLYALVLPENARMLNLLRDLGLPERIKHVDGIERVELDLDGAAGTAASTVREE